MLLAIVVTVQVRLLVPHSHPHSPHKVWPEQVQALLVVVVVLQAILL